MILNTALVVAFSLVMRSMPLTEAGADTAEVTVCAGRAAINVTRLANGFGASVTVSRERQVGWFVRARAFRGDAAHMAWTPRSVMELGLSPIHVGKAFVYTGGNDRGWIVAVMF